MRDDRYIAILLAELLSRQIVEARKRAGAVQSFDARNFAYSCTEQCVAGLRERAELVGERAGELIRWVDV